MQYIFSKPCCVTLRGSSAIRFYPVCMYSFCHIWNICRYECTRIKVTSTDTFFILYMNKGARALFSTAYKSSIWIRQSTSGPHSVTTVGTSNSVIKWWESLSETAAVLPILLQVYRPVTFINVRLVVKLPFHHGCNGTIAVWGSCKMRITCI